MQCWGQCMWLGPCMTACLFRRGVQHWDTGKFSDFPFWDKTGNITQFWEIIGVFHPILGNLLESKGKKLSQKQEILGK